ncbi:hypothetical protein [Yersinia kristensenii]|uniref:Bacteriophage protein n=1 Tax=Yersinia kristensenii TaxID=28152 RepID=A0AB73NPV2_YERKR|nr:hypothetical protein [Yersinia kristensenii]OVZ82209.1 hypothetical protein CBW52_05215 [Yersinia kristensenii]
MKIITRTDAARVGQLKYYTGKPCRNGHLCERYTVNGSCVECNANHTIAQRKRIKSLMAHANGLVVAV